MSDFSQPPEDPDDQSLANQPLQPVEDLTVNIPTKAGGGILVASAATAALFMFVGSTMMPCIGATRSARLKWEQRQAEIEQAANDVDHSPSTDGDSQEA